MKQNLNEPSIKTIGRNIRRWREFREMKGEELAQRIGLTKGSLSNIENGKTDLTLNKIEEIAGVLGLTAHHLLSSDPQSIITLTESPNSNGINYGTQNNVDADLLSELRQQLKIKDEQIQFLQAQFRTK